MRARLKPKDLARKAGVSLAALYNCERADRGGRTKTLIALALALGLSLRIPDLPALSAEQGLRERSWPRLVALPSGLSDQPGRAQTVGNVRTLERVAHALGEPVVLVVGNSPGHTMKLGPWAGDPLDDWTRSRGLCHSLFRVSSLDFANLPRTPQGTVDFAKDFFGRESFLTVSGQLNVEACPTSAPVRQI